VDFIQRTEIDVRGKCKEDLISTTRYITWSLHTRSGFGLRNIIGDVSASSAVRSHELCMVALSFVSWGQAFGQKSPQKKKALTSLKWREICRHAMQVSACMICNVGMPPGVQRRKHPSHVGSVRANFLAFFR
jgi:hypothetical protein